MVALFQPQAQVCTKSQLMGTESYERQCATAKAEGQYSQIKHLLSVAHDSKEF